MSRKETVALLPGSYDPVTCGHLSIIERTSRLFDRVIVAVMTNDMTKYTPGAKVKTYLFSMEQRAALVRLACENLSNVEVITDSGMLIELFDRVGAITVVKGVRNATDFAYEQEHAHWNRAHNPQAETLYMPADPAFDAISSTAVRAKIERGESLASFVPPKVEEQIRLYLPK